MIIVLRRKMKQGSGTGCCSFNHSDLTDQRTFVQRLEGCEE